jgi:hypothetical protein
LIDRFSEDVDLTVNIQHLWRDVDLAPAVNPSQAERRRKAADSKLKQWVSEIPIPPANRMGRCHHLPGVNRQRKLSHFRH